jgi:hypothetical protein
MGIVQSGHDQIIGVEHYFPLVGLYEVNFCPVEHPVNLLLLDVLAVSVDETLQLSFVVELEYLQSLLDRELSVCLFCAFGDLKADCLRNLVQEGTEID